MDKYKMTLYIVHYKHTDMYMPDFLWWKAIFGLPGLLWLLLETQYGKNRLSEEFILLMFLIIIIIDSYSNLSSYNYIHMLSFKLTSGQLWFKIFWCWRVLTQLIEQQCDCSAQKWWIRQTVVFHSSYFTSLVRVFFSTLCPEDGYFI